MLGREQCHQTQTVSHKNEYQNSTEVCDLQEYLTTTSKSKKKKMADGNVYVTLFSLLSAFENT